MVDPIIRTYSVQNAVAADLVHPDVAYLAGPEMFGYTHEVQFSANDHDVYFAAWTAGTQAVQAGINWVDLTNDDWFAPSIAGHHPSDSFVVACMATSATGHDEVWGRSIKASNQSMSPRFMIANAGTSWENSSVDIGGVSFDNVGTDPM